jgi:GNAT superfamily N-acetyltransferase
MSLEFREATRCEVMKAVELLRDDGLGRIRETAEEATYLAAFDAMVSVPGNRLIVGVAGGDIVATYQLTLIPGISLGAALRAQIEGIRVASSRRGQGIGAALLRDAEARARAAGATLLQLTMNAERVDARRFYCDHGFKPSHTGFKKPL